MINDDLTAKIEPFDSFWEAPEDIESGFTQFYEFYRKNYLKYVPPNRDAAVLVISCGPGYFVNMLNRHGYTNVLGIDSYESKVAIAKAHGLNCRVARAFPYLEERRESFDTVFCEQELNHLTKSEIVEFLDLVHASLKPSGTLIVHALNGENPVTGAESLAQNFDHYNTFIEYTLRQILEYRNFTNIEILPLNLYVFYKNPFNFVAWGAAIFLSFIFRALFVLYGKANTIFTKKIGAVCQREQPEQIQS